MRRDLMSSSRPSRRRGSAALVAVLGLLALAMALALLTLTGNSANVKHTTQAQEDVELHFLTMAALNQAYVEVEDMTDHDGDGGIGALAVTQLRDSTNDVIGEYMAYVVNTADPDYSDPTQEPNYVVRVMVAVPSFAAATLTRTAEARITPEVVFALSPKVGAVSIAGPLTSNPDLSYWDSNGFSINGNGFPAVVFTDEASRTNFVEDDTIDVNWFSNDLDSKIGGAPLNTFERPGSPSTFDAPFTVEQDAAFTAEMLNDYRDALRSYYQGLVSATDDGAGSVNVNYGAAAANGVVVLHTDTNYTIDAKPAAGHQPKLKAGTHTFADKVVLLDTSKFADGGSDIAENHADGSGGGAGTTITGSGTLVILHPIGSRTDNNNGKQFNLDWDGDVVVIGYTKDRTTGVGTNATTDNLLYISRADWSVDGNVILLTQGTTEASLEMQGTNSNPATLNVNGSVMLFAEASTREAEIDIESHAEFRVNGLVALFGSRVELENQSSTNTTFEVNGTMAVGFPTDSTRSDDLTWRVRGNADFTFNQEYVESAIENLSALQSNLNLSGTNLQSLDFTQRATITRSTSSLAAFQAERQALIDASHPTGVDRDLILSTMMD